MRHHVAEPVDDANKGPPPPDAGPNWLERVWRCYEPCDWALVSSGRAATWDTRDYDDGRFRDHARRVDGWRAYRTSEVVSTCDYRPAIDAADEWRAYMWRLRAIQMGFEENTR